MVVWLVQPYPIVVFVKSWVSLNVPVVLSAAVVLVAAVAPGIVN